LRKKHRLRVFENRALMRIFRPKRDKVTGEWRKLHYEELICIVKMIKSRKIRWAGHVAHTGERRGVYRIMMRKPE
jgi:hypothetical protein